MQKEILRSSLLAWYKIHQRALPWRKTKDPYHIWLSEIILQQTRVNQGLSYYRRFIEHYPTVEDLANASQEQVLKDWEGLGYYSRARNLHFAAKSIFEQGYFPDSYHSLLQLKGVGDYTASAIASFAYNESQAVVDGNVYRVLSRLYGCEIPINTSAGVKHYRALAQNLLDPEQPAEHNQAMMELGALQCVPKSPDCTKCPWSKYCSAYQSQRVDQFPIKEKKKYDRKRFLNYLLLERGDGTVAVEQRLEGIWQGLYQFPLVESIRAVEWPALSEELQWPTWLSPIDRPVRQDLPVHKLSHQSLYIVVWHLRVPPDTTLPPSLQWWSVHQLYKLAFPRPLRRFLDSNQLTLRFG